MKPLALLFTLVLCGPAWADDVSDLIKQLDAEIFREREQAADKLEALGKEAVPALVEAAGEGTLEISVRSIEILKKLMEAEDKQTATDAKVALEKLAEGENAGTARRAKNALAPKPLPVPEGVPNRVPFGGFRPVQVVPGNAVRRINTVTVNGVKTVEVEEGDRKVKIQEDPKTGIQVEITEKKNGQDVTEKFEAKNEADLKKNHPRAHAEFAKYAKANNAVRVQFGRPAAVPIGRPAVPFGRAALPVNQRVNGIRLDSAGRLLQSLGRHIESLTDENVIKEASNESRESLKKEVVEMKNRLAELEKKLQSAIDEDNKQNAAEEKEKTADDTPAEAKKPENAQPE